jgi:hypothetical protein
MTKAEYKKLIDVSTNKILMLESKISEIMDEVMDNSPFKRGEKVLYNGEEELYIYAYNIDLFEGCSISYTLTKLDKDGNFPKVPVNPIYLVSIDEIYNVV